MKEKKPAAGGRAETGVEFDLFWCVYLDGQELGWCLNYLILKRVMPP